MKELIIGIISGTITGMGIGGGTILIIFVVLFCGLGQREAELMNLIFFIPTAIISTIINLKNKNINFKLWKNITAFGILGTIIGLMIKEHVNIKLMRKLFGIFLLIIVVKEIYSIFKSE